MLADRICVMRAGRILQLGEPADIYYRPADPFVAGFIGETNCCRSRCREKRSRHLLRQRRHQGCLGRDRRLPLRLRHRARACPDDGAAGVDPQAPRQGQGRLRDRGYSLPRSSRRVAQCSNRARSDGGQDLAIEIQGTSALPMALGEQVRLGWPKRTSGSCGGPRDA